MWRRLSRDLTDIAKELSSSVTSNITAMKVLKSSTKTSIMGSGPLAMAKIGRVVQNMQNPSLCNNTKFTDDEIDLVVNAIYVTQSDEHLSAVFSLFLSKIEAKSLPRIAIQFQACKVLEQPSMFAKLEPEFVFSLSKLSSDKPGMEWKEISRGSLEGCTAPLGALFIDLIQTIDQQVRVELFDKAATPPTLMGSCTTTIKELVSRCSEDSKSIDLDIVRTNDKGATVVAGQAKLSGVQIPGLRAEKFRTMVLLCGEDLREDQVDEMFKKVDTDGSGVVDFKEFKVLMKAINPDLSQSFTSSIASGLGDNLTLARVLRTSTKTRLGTNSKKLSRVAKTISSLQDAKGVTEPFTNVELDFLIRAVFVTTSNGEFHHAFQILKRKLMDSNTTRVSVHLSCAGLGTKKIFGTQVVKSFFVEITLQHEGSQQSSKIGTTEKLAHFEPSFMNPVFLNHSLEPEQILKLRVFQDHESSPILFAEGNLYMNDLMIARGRTTTIQLKLLHKSEETLDLKPTLTAVASEVEGLSAVQFRSLLPLLTDTTEDQINEVFKQTDTDGSNSIELEEFKSLLVTLNPREEEQALDDSWDTSPTLHALACCAWNGLCKNLMERLTESALQLDDTYKIKLVSGNLAEIELDVLGTRNAEYSRSDACATLEAKIELCGAPHAEVELQSISMFSPDVQGFAIWLKLEAHVRIKLYGLNKLELALLERPQLELDIDVGDAPITESMVCTLLQSKLADFTPTSPLVVEF